VSVAVIGDAFVDLMVSIEGVRPGETYHRRISMFPGGLSNVAIEISRLGERVKFFGKVGDDPFGRYFKQALAKNGVKDLTLVDPELPTGLCVCLVYENGERAMIASRGANDNITVEDVKQHINELKSSRIAYFSGYSLLKEGTKRSILFCMEECRNAGVEIFFNPGAPNLIREDFSNVIRSYVDVLILNQDEATSLCKSGDLRSLNDFVELAVVTRGRNGCALVKGREVIEIRTSKVNVENTTGAGDAFVAGYIVGRLRGLDELESARLGNRVAAEFLIRRESCTK
jgi:sugar/nucleoside kinase (ribokinase family)